MRDHQQAKECRDDLEKIYNRIGALESKVAAGKTAFLVAGFFVSLIFATLWSSFDRAAIQGRQNEKEILILKERIAK